MGIKFPTPWKTLIIKFPPPRDGKGVIEDLLLSTLFRQSEPLPNEVRRLATLATGQGGLGIPDLNPRHRSSLLPRD